MKSYAKDVLGWPASDPQWPFAEFSKNALYTNSDLALRTKRVKNLPPMNLHEGKSSFCGSRNPSVIALGNHYSQGDLAP